MAKVIEDTGYTNLTASVNTIKNEQNKGGNTKTRVGNMFQAIIEYLHNRNIEGGGGGISDLTGYSWWGQHFPTEGTDEQKKTLKGSLSGDIDFIQFSNGVRVGVDSASNTLKVYKDGSTANIYATGGVSALGMSSSGGGGGGGGTDLGTFLSKLNNDNPSLSQGYLYYSGGNNGTFYMTAGGGGSGLTPGNLAKALDGVTAPTGGTTRYLYFDGSGYGWGNPGGSSYILPTASNSVLGGVKVGNGLTITDGVLSVSQMNVPIASSSTLGGVIVRSGSGLSVDRYGNLSIDSSNITASKLGTTTVGSSTQPIYLNGGSPTLCNKYAGGTAVTLNGGSKAANTASFWAPTYSGNSNQVLKSNGNTTAPEWINQSSLTVGKADRLSGTGTRTVWGQTYWQDGAPKNVTGDMTSVGSITMSGYIYMNNNNGIGIKDTYSNHDYLTVLGFNTANIFFIGYGTRKYGYPTDIQGGKITFATNNGVTGNKDSRLEVAEFTSTGQLCLKQYDSLNKGLKIGNVVLYYNTGNKALCIQNSDGTPANFYATGGVSALGMSAGTSSIDSMTFNYLTVSNRLNIGNSSNYLEKDNNGRIVITSNQSIRLNCPVSCENGLDVNGSLTATLLRLNSTHYFKLDSNGVLKFMSGTTEKTVSLV